MLSKLHLFGILCVCLTLALIGPGAESVSASSAETVSAFSVAQLQLNRQVQFPTQPVFLEMQVRTGIECLPEPCFTDIDCGGWPMYCYVVRTGCISWCAI